MKINENFRIAIRQKSIYAMREFDARIINERLYKFAQWERGLVNAIDHIADGRDCILFAVGECGKRNAKTFQENPGFFIRHLTAVAVKFIADERYGDFRRVDMHLKH